MYLVKTECMFYNGTSAKSPFFCFSTVISRIDLMRPARYVFDPSTRTKHRLPFRVSLLPSSGREAPYTSPNRGSHHISFPLVLSPEFPLRHRCALVLSLTQHSALGTQYAVPVSWRG